MSVPLFLAVFALMIGGLFLLSCDYRKIGGLTLGAAIFLFMVLMPWPMVDLLIKENNLLARWAAPRMEYIRRGWCWASAAFSAVTGLCVAFFNRPKGKREVRWDAPTRAGNPAKLLNRLVISGDGTGTFLGIGNDRRPVFLNDKARESHMQIVGPTRSGKSQLLLALAAQDMRRGLPVFFMEAKGDRSDFDQFLKLADLTGRADRVLYLNPQDERSMSFNPIRQVPGQDPTAIANQIARAIGREPTASGEGQDYYRSVDYAKIQNMTEVFCKTRRQFTLKDCFYYVTFQKARERAFQLCTDKRLVGIALDEFTRNPDTSALSAAFQPWCAGRLGAILNSYNPAIRLERIFEEGWHAYFAIPIGHLQVLANPLGRMIISGLLSVAAWRQKMHPKPGPASVILDEFAEFATPVFASFIATVGSARLWTVLSHQDLGQLKKVKGMDPAAFSSAVFNNTSGCKVCFRTPDPEDAEFWSSTLGTFTTFATTERAQKGLLGLLPTGEMSLREVEQFKVHPNLLKNLAPGRALIFAPGNTDCMARTAAASAVVGRASPAMPAAPETEPEDGMDLASAVDNPGRVRQTHASGRPMA